MPILSKPKQEKLAAESAVVHPRKFRNAKLGRVKKELKDRISGYVVGAFGLIAALAWNDAIASFIKIIFPESSSTLVAKFLYALIMTVVVVIVAMYATKILEAENKK